MNQSAHDRRWIVATELDSDDAYRAFIATTIFRTIQDAQAVGVGDTKFLGLNSKDPSCCAKERVLLRAHGNITAWINSKDFHRWCQITGRDGPMVAQFVHDLMFGQRYAVEQLEKVLAEMGNHVDRHKKWYGKRRQIKEPLRLMKLFQLQ